MAVTLRYGLSLPFWAVAFCALALSTPQHVMPFLMTLLAIGVIVSTMPAILGRFGRSRRTVEVLPALVHVWPIDDRGGTRIARRRLP